MLVYMHRYKGNDSPNTDKWMWEKAGYDAEELTYNSEFGSASARWVIKDVPMDSGQKLVLTIQSPNRQYLHHG